MQLSMTMMSSAPFNEFVVGYIGYLWRKLQVSPYSVMFNHFKFLTIQYIRNFKTRYMLGK
jgi:hypothetical protein